MFEISVFCVILFAIAYWATLFIMGRREDVLHGEFVEPEPEFAPVSASMDEGTVEAEPVSAPAPVARADLVPPVAPVVNAEPAPVAVVRPVPRPSPTRTPVNNEKLQSLLASIKRELKNAAQI